MKFSIVALTIALAVAEGHKLTKSLLDKSTVMKGQRSLESDEDGDANGLDYSVLLGSSVKLGGCSTQTGWVEGSWTVQRQVFSLICSESDCLENSCDANSYAQVVTELGDFVTAYAEYETEYTASLCQNELYEYEVEAAAAEEAGTDMGEFTWSDSCNTKDYNPNYVSDEYSADEEEFELSDYSECQQVEWTYVSGYNSDGEAQEVDLYMGVGCNKNKISIELWTDSYCSVLAESVTGMSSSTLWKYLQRQGNEEEDNGEEEEEEDLKVFNYFSTDVIDDSCVSCTVADNLAEANEEDAEDNYEAESKEVMEVCQNIYTASLLCESAGSSSAAYLNGVTSGCGYISQMVQLTFSDTGEAQTYTTQNGSAIKTSAWLFSGTAIGLAFYVSMLKKKVDSSTINLGN